MEATRADEVTATPADRSNSPPIISSATATAGMPYVELTYSTEDSDSSWRNGGGTGAARRGRPPTGRLPGAGRGELADERHVVLVDEVRPGQRRLAAAQDVAV